MMPTFPRSPLSFRTASFPQYGWKADCPSGAFLGDRRLKPAPGIRRPPSSLHPPFVHFVVATVVRSESGGSAIPDFSGQWGRDMVFFEPPPSGLHGCWSCWGTKNDGREIWREQVGAYFR